MKHRHITDIAFLLCVLSAFVACTRDKPAFPGKEGDDHGLFLTFRTAVAGSYTRVGEDNDANVNTLRIVIVSQGKEPGATWTVEHNSKVSLTKQLHQIYSFKVEADRKKRIYLIANEDGLVGADENKLDFSDASFIPDDSDRAGVDEYVFAIGESYSYNPSALPMTAVYEFDVPAAEEVASGEYPLPDPLYLVRAATKFSFEFTNQSTQRVITVTGIDVGQVITNQMYLMPHVQTKEDGKYWVVEETNTDGMPSQYCEKVLEDGTDWVDWIGQEAKDSETGIDKEWLTDYEIPDSKTSVYEFKTNLEMNKSTGTEPYPTVNAPNAFYLPESRTEKTGVENLYKLQEYSITVHTTENGETKEYTVTLPNLASLFRNTHVIVGAIFTDMEIEVTVDVIPYGETILKPSFGL